MSFGKYRLKHGKHVRKAMLKSQQRYNRLCGPVTIIKSADPEKVKEFRRKHR